MFLLDTDSVSYALRGHGRVAEQLTRRNPSEVCISSITLAELEYGVRRRASRRLRRIVDAFVAGIDVRPFDEAAAVEFGRVATALQKRGTPISQYGQYDALIAAHALSLQCTVVTGNLKHFSQVPGLKTENWA